MKKSIFTLMALMATAVCGLTSCNDSDDDYVAPAAAAAVPAPTGDSLDGYTIRVVYPNGEAPYVFENGNVTDPGGQTYTYTYDHATGKLEMYDQTQAFTIEVILKFTDNTWTNVDESVPYTITYTKA